MPQRAPGCKPPRRPATHPGAAQTESKFGSDAMPYLCILRYSVVLDHFSSAADRNRSGKSPVPIQPRSEPGKSVRSRYPSQRTAQERLSARSTVPRIMRAPPTHCSAVFCSTSAFDTTASPGAIPVATSCRFGGSIFPPVTSTRRNFLPPAGT